MFGMEIKLIVNVSILAYILAEAADAEHQRDKKKLFELILTGEH